MDAEAKAVLNLDLILVTPTLTKVWRTKRRMSLEDEEIWVVSREGLIEMKELRGSGQDQDDIRALREIDGEEET